MLGPCPKCRKGMMEVGQYFPETSLEIQTCPHCGHTIYWYVDTDNNGTPCLTECLLLPRRQSELVKGLPSGKWRS